MNAASASDESDADPHSVRTLSPDELSVVFQPIVDLSTKRTWAVEALTRCTRKHFGNPQKLFEAASSQNATGRLGRLIREKAFARAQDKRIFVNLHPQELSSRWLVRTDDPIGYHRPDVFLEITETAAFEFFDLCRSVLREVHARTNAHLVLDDMGAGYSNLVRFAELEPKFIKLDRALITAIDQNPRKQIMVRHLTSLCRELGTQVVAEGIETVGELSAVIDCGVDYGQGYLLARPGFPIPDVNFPAEIR